MVIRRWKEILTVAIACLASAAWASVPAGPPQTVGFCDLIAHPQAFDGQWIQVHGHISLGFEDFTLTEQGCDKPLTRPIWLDYGGDEETPIKFCCGDHSRPKGKDVVVRGQAVSLVRDAATQELIEKVRARRNRQANGQPCGGALCNFYNVSATLWGLFLAAPEDPKGGLKGYGHLGCCHLLVIYRASDVAAARTAVPLDTVSFTCTTQTWQVELPEGTEMRDPRVSNQRLLAREMRKHGDGELVEIMRNTIPKDAGADGTLQWTSPDLQTVYSAAPPKLTAKQQRADRRRKPPTMTFTRERCSQVP